jgi:hypothetical protein
MALKESSPWVRYYRKIDQLFKLDDDVKVVYEESEKIVIKVYVQGAVKAEAVSALLPEQKSFGNVTAYIEVIPSNDQQSMAQILRNAFSGNPALVEVVESSGGWGSFTYAVFSSRPAQYFADNLGDVRGNETCLLQDLAKEVLEPGKDILFCTEEVY